MGDEEFNGLVKIRVKFRSSLEYQKFRKYILKTDWSYGIDYPIFESLIMEFHNSEDLHEVTKKIVELLQLGFDVYSSHYELITELEADYESDNRVG